MFARKYLLVLNIVNALIFILILFIFSSIFNFRKIFWTSAGHLVMFDFFYALKNILAYIFYFFLYGIAIGCAWVVARIFNAPLIYDFVESFFRGYLSLWFALPTKEAPEIGDAPALITEEGLVFFNNFYLFAFQIAIMFAFVYFVRAIFQNDPKYNLVAIGSLVMMIIIPLMVFGLKDMLILLLIQPEVLEDLINPVSPKLTKIPLNDFFAFLLSSGTLLAIMCYIYLEMSFQINYTDMVTRPSLERSARLERQLDVLSKESKAITLSVDKIKEEAQKRRKELKLEEKETVGKFFAKVGERFSYIKEMIERKKLEEEEKKLVSAASKTRKLGHYVNKLFREDPEANETLTAKSSAPRAKNLATSTAFTFAFRLSLLIAISYIIIHPRWFFVNVFNLPPAITESVEMYSPEAILILLIPFILIFPVIAQLISYSKHRNLIIRLKQEGRIKEILTSVGDYVKTEEVKEEQEESGVETETVATETA